LTRARSELEDWLATTNLMLRDVVGVAADALGSYDEQPERPGRWQNFVPPETTGGGR